MPARAGPVQSKNTEAGGCFISYATDLQPEQPEFHVGQTPFSLLPHSTASAPPDPGEHP
jgi:hypothetical protein